jgi:predicted  nucleic acid-binding Zn-ribbon protein
MNVLEKELHETRATGAEAQQAAQLKTTELEASSQVSKDLQEQLSWLTTEKAAMEQRLQAKTEEVVSLHDQATTSEQQTRDLKTKNSKLQQEVGHLQKSLADVIQINCKMSLVSLALKPVLVKTYRVHWVFCDAEQKNL